MTGRDNTDTSQAESISFEFDLEHSIKKVWRTLTNAELLQEWLLPVIGLELEAGAKFTFQSEPKPGWDGTVHCQLLEIEDLRLLRWKWVVGEIDTVVTFRLQPTTAGTRLTIVHSGFSSDQKQNFAGAHFGWKMMSKKLVDLLERKSCR